MDEFSSEHTQYGYETYRRPLLPPGFVPLVSSLVLKYPKCYDKATPFTLSYLNAFTISAIALKPISMHIVKHKDLMVLK